MSNNNQNVGEAVSVATISELKECLISSLISGSVPILIGAPGVGKSAFARALAKDLDAECIIVYLGHREASEIHGIPVVAKQPVVFRDKEINIVVQSPPDFAIEALKIAETGKNVLIIFDELSCLSPEAMGSALAILHDKKIGGVDLSGGNIGMIACANPSEISAGGYNLAAPLANRLVWYGFPLDVHSWAENFPSYWNDPPKTVRFGFEIPEHEWAKRRALVASYIRSNPGCLLNVPESDTARSGPWPSPRTWTNLSRDLTVAEMKNFSEASIMYIAAGHIGMGEALNFIEWKKSQDLPQPEILLDQPESAWPDFSSLRADQAFAVVMALVAEVDRRAREAANDKSKGVGAKNLASKSWTRAVVVLEKMTKSGVSKDITTLGAGKLAKSKAYAPGTEIPDSIEIFANFVQEAGLNWRN